jgi:hypothetical protein
MAKNASRKSQPAGGGKKKGNSGTSDIQKLKDKAKTRDVLYQVKTKRDEAVIKAFITFTYRVYHPGVTVRLIFLGLLIAAPSIIAKAMWLKVTCLTVGALLILLGLFRQYISVALTKRNDPDYKSGVEYTYEFTSADASFYKGDELVAYINKYKAVMAFYYDEDFYYLAIANRDLFVLPKSRFTVGEPAEFEDFIYQKSKKTCKWIPNNFKDQMDKRRAYRQLNSNKQ